MGVLDMMPQILQSRQIYSVDWDCLRQKEDNATSHHSHFEMLRRAYWYFLDYLDHLGTIRALR